MPSSFVFPTVTGIWNTPGGTSPMADFVQFMHPKASKDLLNYINAHSFPCTIAKGQFLVAAGEVCRHVFFIQKGAMRAYIQEKKKDITTWITTEGEMITSIRGFDLQQPSLENIQAIEDCQLVGAHYDNLQYCYDNFLEMNIVGRKLLEAYYRSAEERAFIARLSTATGRYQHFVATKGHLINRLPLKYIASYLGMTIETLSRIRSSLSSSQ